MKKILGLDLGTNSIGWALISEDNDSKEILGMGSRIIPMSQEILGDFDKGVIKSSTSERTRYRGVRRLHERHLLRRERLHRVLNILGFLPEHYANCIDFEKYLGQFNKEEEPNLVYCFNSNTNKREFIFKKSFDEMVKDFSEKQPQLLEENKKIPYDWTIYYLRKKALTYKIEKEELAWLLLNFNQKRGYYQLRGEDDDENNNKIEEFYTLKVIDVVDSGDKKGKDEIWYNVILENGWVYHRPSKIPLDWIGKTKEFIVTTEIDENGQVVKNKDGKEKRSFRAPKEDDWNLLKKKTEYDIEASNKTVGCYIYDTLLIKPEQKIKGKLVRTIERNKFYKQELEEILKKQKEFHIELNDEIIYNACINELYANNDPYRNSISKKDFTYLLLNDIILYQRPLKSKKSLISNCQYETRIYLKDGTKEIEPLKCIAKSHPLYQEFRLWQFIKNLRIYAREQTINGKTEIDADITNEHLKSSDDWVKLFDWLNERKDIDQKAFLKYFKLKIETHRWNYIDDKENKKTYPCNETHSQIVNKLKNIKSLPDGFLTKEKEESLWHILYSVEDKNQIFTALKTFAVKNSLGDDFAEEFKKFPPFKKDYGAYSAKAIKKLLSLMRMGKYWNENSITDDTKNRLNLITERLEAISYDEKKINTISDDDFQKQVLKSFINCRPPYNGLNTYQACYAVYGRHSESGDIRIWKTPSDIENYLKIEFKQHSLRNPIVEQVITETLRVIADIWKFYGKGEKDFFKEIHIELGREMKNPAEKRKQMTNQVTENENTNLRIKELLIELFNDNYAEDVRPYSPSQLEILKIYEEGVLSAETEIPEDILKISKMSKPSQLELVKYKLWLDQKYRSPYTGDIIPLAKLFTSAYEIEHIIPQSRYFDDSFSNKVICEAEVNKDKDNATAYEYIKNNSGKKIELNYGKVVTLLTIVDYETHVKRHFGKSKGKMKKLMMDDIPDSFISRQMNDSRYISKAVKGLLSNIVREQGEQESTSKNVLSSNGSITTILKQDWGMNDVWNDIITPRFERLNQLTNSNNFGEWTNKEGNNVFQTGVPIELQKGFSKKRIDHRHHAMDALVIACATRNHINFLNNEYANENKKELRYDLRKTLCYKKYNGTNKDNYKWVFTKPWETFTQDAKYNLFNTVVSFKQNLRVINKTVNSYQKWEIDDNGNKKKIIAKQTIGETWAIRKPMHKETVSGKVILRFKKIVNLNIGIDNVSMIVDKSLKIKIKELLLDNYNNKKIIDYFKNIDYKWNDKDISKIEIYYFDEENVASRVKLDDSFTQQRIERSITDTGIQKILLKHLAQEKYQNQKDESGKVISAELLAFSSDGIDEMNNNILQLNNGKAHKPIYKVRTYEPQGNKFQVGYIGNKKDKFVVAATGTNLYYAIYADEKGKLNFETIPLNVVIERLKNGDNPVGLHKSVDGIGELKLKFYLNPNDLVYVPTKDQIENNNILSFDEIDKNRIYRFIDSSDTTANFIPVSSATTIINMNKKEQQKAGLNFIIQNEYGEGSPQSKNQKAITGEMIKNVCVKLRINRLGHVIGIEK